MCCRELGSHSFLLRRLPEAPSFKTRLVRETPDGGSPRSTVIQSLQDAKTTFAGSARDAGNCRACAMVELSRAGDSADGRWKAEPHGSRAPDARWQARFVRHVATRSKPLPF